ncbi:TSUP family transporter [Luteococcus peritonei]|uniref:Probable membrane transporter protein n=1 Tax=Luteococcus peritonei TaxID=88874 RepID=A0ABW4S116_9ACTN
MSPLEIVLLVLAGVGGGLCGYLTGLASLVTYPALLAVGLSPVTANVSNTLGVLAIGVGSTMKAGGQLLPLGRSRLVRDGAVALVGGGIGAGLLLLGGDEGFERVVPFLVALASALLLAQPAITARRGGERDQPRAYLAGLVLTCLYGGYFGAGAGVVFLALALLTNTVGFDRSMVLKSLLLGCSNLAASLVFVLAAPVNWWAALATGVGCYVGGRLGPTVQQWLPQQLLRWAIGLAGFGLALWLGWQAFAPAAAS